ncbi:MAG TPA: hypothetical protein VNM16_05495 [Bacillota bacterium]|nr:hypothetical protein [Bacillota bacterium]
MREAVAPERLRGNPYAGKPLNLKSNPFDQGLGMAHRMLRNAGFTKLPWMEDEEALRRERADLAAFVEAHAGELRNSAQGREQLRARAEDLRRRIEIFNLTVPIASRQMTNINPARILAEVGQS